MHQIRENEDELNNSFEAQRRSTMHKKKPRSVGGFEDEDENNQETPDENMKLQKTSSMVVKTELKAL